MTIDEVVDGWHDDDEDVDVDQVAPSPIIGIHSPITLTSFRNTSGAAITCIMPAWLSPG
jgi:hypothetical protein